MNEQEQITQTAYRNINIILNRIVTMLQTSPSYDFYDDIDDLKYYIGRIQEKKLGTVYLMNGVEFDLDDYEDDVQNIFEDIKSMVTKEKNRKNMISIDVKERINICLDELGLNNSLKETNISTISNSFLCHIFNEDCDYEIFIDKKEEKICLKINDKTLRTNIFKGFGG